ncbi:hypothetical protein [Chitinophaga sancti]|uniref:Uncharacterized protein n=1 Tax=Chitinophaga sancti TaxID=1004 RepID=A0A1K1SIT9_9BACT|nr:hypothetical protein [Chitinophaga sancti]WQD64440.1 hypothetical protein U0033_08530 [Chitinophaga sancti]WQG89936.1 hypothetical protein SR876_00390 [Chitinophaga sancti]SFW84265.1 hypothetical protein SAMN05661012_05508 [Chitinophaga sancti]
MSELRSLFVKLNIKKENLDRFLAAALTAPVVDEDWTAWWDSRKMYSKSSLEEIPTALQQTNGAVFESCVNFKDSFSQAKLENGVFYFISGFFSENFHEILPMLAVLKSAALYMEPGEEGIAIIYDYFWGDGDVLAHLDIKAGHAELKHTTDTTQIDKMVLAESDEMIQDVIDTISSAYDD